MRYNQLTTKIFIEKARKIHGWRYDYSKVIYVNNYTPVIIICSIHGEFLQSPKNHLKGCNCPICVNGTLTLEEFIQRARLVHGDRFDYSKTIYIDSYTKVIITCPEHGEFEQIPASHLFGIGCFKCGNPTLTLEEFIQRAREIHGDKYGYENFIIINTKTKGLVTCETHGDFQQTPDSHLRGNGCPKCKRSKGEELIESILNKHNIISIPQWKHPDEKYLFEYDFYLPDYRILIEFHGIQHYEWIPYFQKTYHDFEEQCLRDKYKVTLAKTKGIPIIEIHYKNLELPREQFEQFVISKINKYSN